MTLAPDTPETLELLGTVLAYVVLLSLILERALALLFEWRLWQTRATGVGLRTPVVFVTAWMLCAYMELDVLLLIAGKTGSDAWNGWLTFGVILTAAVIAGGSKGAILLFQGVLGFGRQSIDARLITRRMGADSYQPPAPPS